MRLVVILFLSIVIACKPLTTEEDLHTNSKEDEDTLSIESAENTEKSTLLDLIPNQYQLYLDKENELPSSDYQDTIEEDYVLLANKTFEARLYADLNGEFIAINNIILEDNCTRYQAFLLRKNEEGFWEDQFNIFYPNLSLYSFYSFEDEETMQLEGDEETVFAGYYFDLNSADKLGIQFMFCNLRDAENTKLLNLNAKRIYKDIHE